MIVSDIRKPGGTGLEILEGMHTLENFPPMILITALGDEETHAKALRLEAAAIFDKPFDIEDLLAKVRKILQPSLISGKKISPVTDKGGRIEGASVKFCLWSYAPIKRNPNEPSFDPVSL